MANFEGPLKTISGNAGSFDTRSVDFPVFDPVGKDMKGYPLPDITVSGQTEILTGQQLDDIADVKTVTGEER